MIITRQVRLIRLIPRQHELISNKKFGCENNVFCKKRANINKIKILIKLKNNHLKVTSN